MIISFFKLILEKTLTKMKIICSFVTFCIIFQHLQLSHSEISIRKLLFPRSKLINLRRFNVFPVHMHNSLHIQQDKARQQNLELEREKELKLEREKELKIEHEKKLKLEREDELRRQKFNSLIQNNLKLAFLREFYGPRNF